MNTIIFKFLILSILFISRTFGKLSRFRNTNNILDGYDSRILPVENPNIKNNIKRYFHTKILLDKLKNQNITFQEKINMIKNIEYQNSDNKSNNNLLYFDEI